MSAVAAAFAVVAAVAVPVTTFVRRPRLRLIEDVARVHTRLEALTVPWIRLVVTNEKRRRAAQGTRVFVEHYRTQIGGSPVSMGSPELSWPSALGDNAGAVVFAGGSRPLDLGALRPAAEHAGGQLLMSSLTGA